MASPTSRKTTAVSRYAKNSQTVSMASEPVAVIALPGPTLPSTIAAVTVAITPDRWKHVGEHVTAVREHDRDRQLDQVIVDAAR